MAKVSKNDVAVQNTILAQMAEMQKGEEASGDQSAELDSIIPQEFSAVDVMFNDNRWFFNVVTAGIKLLLSLTQEKCVRIETESMQWRR